MPASVVVGLGCGGHCRALLVVVVHAPVRGDRHAATSRRGWRGFRYPRSRPAGARRRRLPAGRPRRARRAAGTIGPGTGDSAGDQSSSAVTARTSGAARGGRPSRARRAAPLVRATHLLEVERLDVQHESRALGSAAERVVAPRARRGRTLRRLRGPMRPPGRHPARGQLLGLASVTVARPQPACCTSSTSRVCSLRWLIVSDRITSPVTRRRVAQHVHLAAAVPEQGEHVDARVACSVEHDRRAAGGTARPSAFRAAHDDPTRAIETGMSQDHVRLARGSAPAATVSAIS